MPWLFARSRTSIPLVFTPSDSITVAPSLTLTDREYQNLRDIGIAVIREVGVDTGGCNIQFAMEPETGRVIVIEMNPRVSRSSALASKAGAPDRQDRSAIGTRIHARRDPERHHRLDPGVVRALDRLRRMQDPALCLREVPRRQQPADHHHEVGGRSNGHWP